MVKLIVGVGLPGSGKSTMLRQFADAHEYAYVCPDDIRRTLSGDAADQQHSAETWQIVYAEVEHHLRNNRSVVVDATFANADERRRFLAFGKRYGAEKIQGVFLDVPSEVAHERNAARERVVPPHAIDRMNAQLRDDPPKLEDGFDALFTFDEFQKLLQSETERGERKRPRPQ